MGKAERRYGQWAGDEQGSAENKTRCIEEVYPSPTRGGWIPYQCTRKRGHGPDSLYCKQHGIKEVARRKRNHR